MPEQIENMMVIDELWRWKEDPDYFAPDRRRMLKQMEEHEREELHECII